MRPVTLEKKDGVAVITLNRPEKRNALTLELRQELYRILEDVDSDETTRAAIITGAGEAFAAGADIRAMQTYTVEDAMESAQTLARGPASISLAKQAIHSTLDLDMDAALKYSPVI